MNKNSIIYAFMLLVMICTISCSNIISEGIEKNDGSDTTFPLPKINPVNNSIITSTSDIEIFFNTSMDSNTLELGGDLCPEARAAWKTMVKTNDTLTLSPRSQWSEGFNRTLTIYCKDPAGNAIARLNFSYSIKIEKKWSGTQQFGSDKGDGTFGVAVDSLSNIYVTGFTNGAFDGYTNAGNDDIFLVKYDSSGEKQWIRQLGSTNLDHAYEVSTDSTGNIYIVGCTQGSFAGYTNAGSDDIFLVKYNPSGEKQWTRQMGTNAEEKVLGFSIAGTGDIYVAGLTKGAFDGYTNAGSDDIFLVKYNSSGEKQWIRQMGTDYDAILNIGGVYGGLSTDSTGNIYIVGSTNDGSIDIFLVKYNPSGEKQWTRKMGTDSPDLVYGVSTDSADNIYVTGCTDGAFDGYTNAESYDIFLVKYNSSGEKQWIRQLGTDYKVDIAYSVSTAGTDNIYITGFTYGHLDGETNAGEADIFLVKYNSSGEKQWTRLMGSKRTDTGMALSAVDTGSIYVTGYTNGELDGNTNAGEIDIFLAKYNSSGEKQ